MKKTVCTSLCIAMLSFAGSAGAVSTFYEMQEGFSFNKTNNTKTWEFDLDNDVFLSNWDGPDYGNPYGDFVNINHEDLIKSAFIGISFFDADNYTSEYLNSNNKEIALYQEKADIIVDGVSLLANGPRDFDTEFFQRNVKAYLLDDHLIRITINWFSGDFEVYSVLLGGTFVDKPPINDPVPEPTTLILFGTGLAGLAAVGRNKSNR